MLKPNASVDRPRTALTVLRMAAALLLIVHGVARIVHGREGWFVVGAGRNGMEYSVLLITVLAAVAYAAAPALSPESSE